MSKPVLDHKQNFETLKRAFQHEDVALMECELVATGERVAVICAASPVGDEIEFTPFAMFFNGNPYDMLRPPNPDGGFHQEEKA
jgi:hypothetical protein